MHDASGADRYGQYWQRTSVADAAYQQGVLAQEMLNRNIAECISKIKTLENLGELKNGFPRDGKSAGERAYDRLANPPPISASIDELGRYRDFDGCMAQKGWERVKYVPYGVAHDARKIYIQNHVRFQDPPSRNNPQPYFESSPYNN